jgi:hypothetical protein
MIIQDPIATRTAVTGTTRNTIVQNGTDTLSRITEGHTLNMICMMMNRIIPVAMKETGLISKIGIGEVKKIGEAKMKEDTRAIAGSSAPMMMPGISRMIEGEDNNTTYRERK